MDLWNQSLIPGIITITFWEFFVLMYHDCHRIITFIMIKKYDTSADVAFILKGLTRSVACKFVEFDFCSSAQDRSFFILTEDFPLQTRMPVGFYLVPVMRRHWLQLTAVAHFRRSPLFSIGSLFISNYFHTFFHSGWIYKGRVWAICTGSFISCTSAALRNDSNWNGTAIGLNGKNGLSGAWT